MKQSHRKSQPPRRGGCHSQGWISVHRKIRENELWHLERFTRGQAWLDLVLLTNHSPRSVILNGKEIHLERGQLAYSIKRLAYDWDWNERTVSKFLDWLEKKGMIQCKKSNVTTVITINNYNYYQSDAVRNGVQDTTPMQSKVQTNNNANNGDNDDNEDKESIIFSREKIDDNHDFKDHYGSFDSAFDSDKGINEQEKKLRIELGYIKKAINDSIDARTDDDSMYMVSKKYFTEKAFRNYCSLLKKGYQYKDLLLLFGDFAYRASNKHQDMPLWQLLLPESILEMEANELDTAEDRYEYDGVSPPDAPKPPPEQPREEGEAESCAETCDALQEKFAIQFFQSKEGDYPDIGETDYP